jgi:ADP-heptose:LPS heptosyltransferase
VAVVRLRSLGDCVLTTPAIHLLKSYRPDLEIGVVVDDRFADVYRDNPDIAAILAPKIGAVRGFGPALCLNLHGGTRSARLTALSGARIRAGFDIFRSAWVYTHRLPRAQETMRLTRRVHTAEHAASAMFALGVPLTEIPRARVAASAGRSAHAPAGAYAVIHPLAATAEKTWPAMNFRALAERLDITPVFIGGPGEDLSLFTKWRTVSGESFAEVARLMKDAALFIGNDSGPAHLAAAFGVPELVLFGPSDVEIWSPWRTEAGVIQRDPIASISVEEALEAIPQMVSQ